jgi:hypothetical protein
MTVKATKKLFGKNTKKNKKKLNILYSIPKPIPIPTDCQKPIPQGYNSVSTIRPTRNIGKDYQQFF